MNKKVREFGFFFFFFQAEDGIRGLVRSRGLGDVYKRRAMEVAIEASGATGEAFRDFVASKGM